MTWEDALKITGVIKQESNSIYNISRPRVGGGKYGSPHKREKQQIVMKLQMIILNPLLYFSILPQLSILLLSNQNFIIKMNLKIP